MNITELRIRRAERYEENAGQFVGLVTAVGSNGKQEIVLSAESISAIFAVCRDQISETAKAGAKQIAGAMQSASVEPLLTDQSAVPSLEA